MPKLRIAAGMVLAAAAGGLVVSWRGEVRERVAATDVARAGALAVEPAGTEGAAVRLVHFWSEPTHPSEVQSSGPAIPLGGEAGAVIAEQAALQLLAKDADLELSPRQWAALATATANIQAVRQAFEATIATVAHTPGGRRLEIPAYPAAGDALRAKFHAAVREQLGPTTAAEVLTQLGQALEGHFGGFGVSVQTLEFSATSRPGQSDYQVTRTVRFWNAVEGSARLTTRRETHFPELEDPTGQTWAPFLAVLGGGAEE